MVARKAASFGNHQTQKTTAHASLSTMKRSLKSPTVVESTSERGFALLNMREIESYAKRLSVDLRHVVMGRALLASGSNRPCKMYVPVLSWVWQSSSLWRSG
jgi:hypothetical protein